LEREDELFGLYGFSSVFEWILLESLNVTNGNIQITLRIVWISSVFEWILLESLNGTNGNIHRTLQIGIKNMHENKFFTKTFADTIRKWQRTLS
jgi:hypothetical protein